MCKLFSGLIFLIFISKKKNCYTFKYSFVSIILIKKFKNIKKLLLYCLKIKREFEYRRDSCIHSMCFHLERIQILPMT